MAQALVKNNAYSTLAAGISAAATAITVAVGHGARFPAVSGSNFFFATLISAANVLEIVKVVARSGDILTVVRGQDGTSGAAYALGDRIELRPTAALFDDKMSKGGGVFTGAIEVPSGAATTQAPQVQEVVKRSGDTMTGTLTLPTMQGTSGVVSLPTGHKFVGVDAGSIVAPGMVIKTGYVRADTVTTYAYTSLAGNVESYRAVDALDIVVTPLRSTSKILLMYMLSGDASSQDFVFLLSRNGVVIGRNTRDTNRWTGFAVVGSPALSSLPYLWSMFYLDTPGSTSAQTYRLLVQSSIAGASTFTFYLNRPAASVAVSQYETGISQVYVQEIAQ